MIFLNFHFLVQNYWNFKIILRQKKYTQALSLPALKEASRKLKISKFKVTDIQSTVS